MNFRGFVIERNFEGESMAILDCTFLRCGGFFFFFGGGNEAAFRTPVFSRVIRLIMFYYRVERFVRWNYFKIREWKIDEIEAIFTPRSPRPLLLGSRCWYKIVDFFFCYSICLSTKQFFFLAFECLAFLCTFCVFSVYILCILLLGIFEIYFVEVNWLLPIKFFFIFFFK